MFIVGFLPASLPPLRSSYNRRNYLSMSRYVKFPYLNERTRGDCHLFYLLSSLRFTAPVPAASPPRLNVEKPLQSPSNISHWKDAPVDWTCTEATHSFWVLFCNFWLLFARQSRSPSKCEMYNRLESKLSILCVYEHACFGGSWMDSNCEKSYRTS